jgi:hypothetical protein
LTVRSLREIQQRVPSFLQLKKCGFNVQDAGATGARFELLDCNPLATIPRVRPFRYEIITELVKNGMIERNEQVNKPFSNYHDQGVAGIFDDRAKEVIDRINSNAEVA